MTRKYNDVIKTLSMEPKKWLVTGCAGFIGSNILEELLLNNQIVIGLDNFSTGYQRNLDDVKKIVSPDQWEKFHFIEGDIRNFETCLQATEGVEYVIHQAALGSVPRSIKDPKTSHDVNVTGTLNIFYAASENKIKKVVYASSSSVYGDHPGLPKVEENIGEQLSPYAVTKYSDELYAKVFNKAYGLDTIGLRYFNVFGKRQDPSGAYAAVIPKWVKALVDLGNIEIFGDGETTRDFCYIRNVVEMNILSAVCNNEEAVAQVFNVACSERISLNQLFGILKENLSLKDKAIDQVEPKYADFRPGDIRHSLAQIEKAKKLVGYEPVYLVREGLEEVLPWYFEQVKNGMF